MKRLLLVAISSALFGCSSNPHKAEEIDTEMERSQEVSGENVGTKDGKMIVQRKQLISEELRKLQYEVYALDDHVYGNRKFGSKGLYGVLKDCRVKLSDKTNGGDGKLRWMEPLERVTDKETEFKIGVDENDQLVAVSEEYLLDRIKRFKEYKAVLMKRQDEFEEKIDICKAEARSMQHDVKAAKTPAAE
ncbi:MAG: hypothetical protein COT74_03420 [Bdellovibrionales bacterium CG10_big_fil_rev_8_21_14_0_10_45_34]|nr:MAG: hypothetical protein COT74_03420 [Bdellovibrionales bacterium CG10_big_fil_rev_8_21_14_0_10_45_34]